MKEYQKDVGDTGKLIIQDKTDTAIRGNKVVDLYIQSLSPVSVPNLPWRWYTDEDAGPSGWNSFHFLNTTVPQHLGMIFVDYAHQFTLVLGATGKSQLDGPATFTIDLATVLRPISVKVGAVWKQAIPYVRVGGVWKPTIALVMQDGSWKEAT